jgi:hypothetical protein
MRVLIMVCFQYKDNFKKCYIKFGECINYIDEKLCKSEDGFKDCIFYKMIVKPRGKNCKFMETCSHVASITLSQVSYPEMKKQCETYCLNEENRKNCAIYKDFDDLKDVPIGLLPDGTMIEVKDH